MQAQGKPVVTDKAYPQGVAPDLLNGFMVNTHTYFNRFQTFIDCALFSAEPDGRQGYAYLSSRCRPESIGQDAIFLDDNLYDFAAIETSEGTLALHAGSSQASRNFLGRACKHYVAPTAHPSRVECRQRPVSDLGFDEVLGELQAPSEGRDNHLYLRCDWMDGTTSRTLFAPCRYINFPNPDLDHRKLWEAKPNYARHEDRYIQPISGPVLFPMNGTYYQAYVAAHIDSSGTRRVEFILMDSISFFDLRRLGRPAVRALRRWLSNSFVGRYFNLFDYHRVVPVSGQCRIFRYKRDA